MTDVRVLYPTEFDIENGLELLKAGDVLILPVGTPRSMVHWASDLIERRRPGALIRLDKPAGNFDDRWARALHDELETNHPGIGWRAREDDLSTLPDAEYDTYAEGRGGPTGG